MSLVHKKMQRPRAAPISRAIAAGAMVVVCASAAAQSSTDTGRATLEEIIVTGEKLGRSLKDTATSVTVLDAAALEARGGLDGLDDALARLGNVTDTGSGLAPAVRGVDGTGPAAGGTAFFAGTRTRLNIQVDGRPLSYNESAYGNSTLYDVQQIEVLRGPQSTLQGRNSIAGTIAIKTKDPTFDFEGGVRLAGGSDQFRQGAGYLSFPVIEDQLAVRIAGDYQERQSFVKMRPWPGQSDPGQYQMKTLRGKVLITPAALESFRALLTLNHSESRAPQVEYVTYPYDAHVSASVPTLGSSEPVFEPEATAAILATTWEPSSTLKLESTVSYTDYGVSRSVLPHTGDVQLDGREIIVEPRLKLKLLDGRLDWLSGVFYYESEQSEMIDFVAPSRYEDRTRTHAFFTEALYEATDRWSLTFGGRYEEETRLRYSTQALFPIHLDETVDAFLPKLGVGYKLTDAVTVGAIASRGFNGGGAGIVLAFPVRDYVYDPEYVWNYEAYLRANLSERLSLSLNAFYSDYKDMQVNFDTDPSPGFAVFVINLEDVKVHGADIGIHYATPVGLDLSAEIGVLKSKINTGTLLDGQELARAPNLTATLGAGYRTAWGLELSFDAHYSGEYFSRAVNLKEEEVSSYWVANAKIAYHLRDRAQIFVSSTNLFDTGAETYLYAGLTPRPLASVVRPRTVNAGVSVSF